MLLNTRRSPSLVDVCDFNTLHLREHNASINTKNYLLTQSPQPMSYRDLRLVVTNRIPSNIVILPKSSCSIGSSTDTLILPRRKKERKKPPKQIGFDVYRSLVRSISHCSIACERDIPNDEINRLTNLFTVDRISLLPSTGFFRPHNLPKIQTPHTKSTHKQRSNNKTKTNSKSFPSSNIEYMQATTPETHHPTTPTSQYYDDNEDQFTMETPVLPQVQKNQIRKQLHVYIPQITC
jgi:hypothetical protein